MNPLRQYTGGLTPGHCMASDTCIDRLCRGAVTGMNSAERFFQFRVKGTSSNSGALEHSAPPERPSST